ncbi:ATP-binding protein, partial [Clostridium paraputrificum]|uniref:ATP-binding protein n=1 Tax=Clostridium paraputrificum TaxID=29363 RepID=UPI000AD5BAFF
MINKNIKIDPVDWCIIFGNALDNAIEACEKVEDNRKFISLKLLSRSNTFIVKIINSSENDFIIEEKKYLTTKKNKEEHGIGMDNIRKSIEKYDGILNTRYEKSLFEIS